MPLKIAFAGIDRYFERYYRKGPRRRPVKIDFCDADVLDVFDEWRRATGDAVSPSAAVRSPRSRPVARSRQSLPAHLERVVLRLTSARAGGSLGDDVRRADRSRGRRARRGAGQGGRPARRGARRRCSIAWPRSTRSWCSRRARRSTRRRSASLAREAESELAGFRARDDRRTRSRARARPRSTGWSASGSSCRSSPSAEPMLKPGDVIPLDHREAGRRRADDRASRRARRAGVRRDSGRARAGAPRARREGRGARRGRRDRRAVAGSSRAVRRSAVRRLSLQPHRLSAPARDQEPGDRRRLHAHRPPRAAGAGRRRRIAGRRLPDARATARARLRGSVSFARARTICATRERHASAAAGDAATRSTG